MARLSFVAAILAAAASVAAQTSSIANPFTQAGIPSLSDLPICQTQCATVAQLQANWTGSYSSVCTTSFASSLSTCLTCVASSSLGQALITPQTEQQVATALANYEASCQQAGSPVTINLSSILAATASETASSSTGQVSSTSTSAPTSTASTGAGFKDHMPAGAVFGIAAVIAVNLF